MKHFITQGIILSRTNFGEADRILTFLTPDHGKVKVIAKSVRRANSKLAGGVELFSISDLTLVVGKSEIKTLISARLVKHFAKLAGNLDRSKVAYEVIRKLNRVTEENTEREYFKLLKIALAGLDETNIDPQLTEIWFNLRLLKLTGHAPNLKLDNNGQKLVAGDHNFDFDRMAFTRADNGKFGPNHIKFLRICIAASQPRVINRVNGANELAAGCLELVNVMLRSHTRASA